MVGGECRPKARKSKRLQIVSTDLISLVRQRLAMKGPAAKIRNVQLALVNDRDTPPVQVEAPEIDLLLDEWISNTLNAARPGSTVEVEVRVKAGQLMMSVYNTRADESQPDASPGRRRKRGLTATTIDRSVLSVVSRTIENYKGHLQVDSGSDLGPRLTVRLPLTRAKAQRGAERKASLTCSSA
jgi:signal transduction histidine kinase